MTNCCCLAFLSRIIVCKNQKKRDKLRSITEADNDLRELKELLAMMVWNYNGTPHSSLGGLTPLEAMEHRVLGIGLGAARSTCWGLAAGFIAGFA